MAGANQGQTVKLTINDVEIDVPQGELIVESVKRLGLEIPIFCYHPRMKPVGMCRMCLVEVGFKQPDGSVRKMPKPQAGCTLPASEGMVVYTDTELIHNDRRGVLEFLLANHPLDCPICDRGGECPLQNNTLAYGPSTSRFIELKRHLPKAFPLSKYVTLDLERCIQCGRCVRFTEEISGDHDLAFRFRGAEMQPSTFQLTEFESKFSGNVIEICPVGALTSARYRFRARPWDLETAPSVCTQCSNGCNTWFDHRVGRFVRVNARTNEAVNEDWTCDRGKFGHDNYNSPGRLTTPLVRQGEGLAETGWSEAYEALFQGFEPGGAEVAGLVGPEVSNEALFLFANLFRTAFKSPNLDYRWRQNLVPAGQSVSARLGVEPVQGRIADLETAGSILVFGTSLADELPIAYLRVRKAATHHGAKVVVATDRPTEVERFATVTLHYRPGTGATLAAGLLAQLVKDGRAEFPPATRDELAKFDAARVENETGVSQGGLRAAAALLPGARVLTSHALYNFPDAASVMEHLAGMAMATGGRFDCWATGANDQGAEELGVRPDAVPGATGLDTRAVLEGCATGRIKALWLFGADPFVLHPDQDLVRRALETVPFLAYAGSLTNEAVHYASVVLPMALPAEAEGTFTNCERRVQLVRPAVPPPGLAKPAWRIVSECLLRATDQTPFFNPAEVLTKIAETVPAFAGIGADSLAGEGFLLGARSGASHAEAVGVGQGA
ncbi:MAG: NADH-quinone oxidoreductase subunit NuoG [Fimbriimonadaceae bacterium]|nr:NADH-quinone oxidoreductase subunit NuoG [Fimbriimonadaceae bacterium]QYK56810.1 MAG: NADH-quinone oxidoreductase subunit NuoG [Fimbriimonadaceae bacterium]